jgi:hypothetical protein
MGENGSLGQMGNMGGFQTRRSREVLVWSFLMFVLTPADGLRCVWFIYPVLCWCPEIGTSSIDWAQLSRLLPEDGDRIQSLIRRVLRKKRIKTGLWIMSKTQ